MRVIAFSSLFESLSELLSSKRPNAIKPESEGDPILKPSTNIERVVLNSHSTAIEGESCKKD